MVDEKALLRAICDAPSDDAPRLVYADLLDETGGPAEAGRAEFIRTQIRLAGSPLDPRTAQVFEQRAWQLLHDHNPTWLGPMGVKLWGVTYRRGFLDVARTRSDLLLENAEWFALQSIQELDVELVPPAWTLFLTALRRTTGASTDAELLRAWQTLVSGDPRPVLIAAGGAPAALARHALVERVPHLRLGVNWQLLSARFQRAFRAL